MPIKTKMQHLFFHIVLFFLFFKMAVTQATVPILPDDFKGINTENYVAAVQEDENYSPSLAQTGGIMFELGRYFNEKYPNDEIFDENYEDIIIADLQQFLPDENYEQLRDRLSLLRSSIKVYRAGSRAYNKYIEQKIAPQEFRKVHSKDDYDHENEFSYIQPPEGEFTKIYNFKKFLSYSDNPQEREAIHKYEQSLNEEMSLVDKIDYIYQKIEWKKLPGYGRTEKNPLLSDLGVGEWQKGKNVDARLLSPEIYTDKKEKIYIGVHATTRQGYFILANNLNNIFLKPQIDLSASENVKNYKILYPIPLQTPILAFAQKYYGDFIIPLEIEPENSLQPLKFKASVDFVACNSSMECNPEHFDLSLNLEVSGREFLPNGFENFFNMALQTVPEEQNPDLTLKKLVVDADKEAQSLRLEFKTKEKVRSFKVFVEQKNGFAKFEAPLISVRDGVIYARITQFNDGKQIDLHDKEFIVSAELNGKQSLRTTMTAHKASLFDAQKQSLSLMIIFLAFLGGIILNFMPCVFPVLALKIMALSRAPSRKRKNIKQALKHTVFGIWSGFALIIVFLCGAKYLGESLGWGMQFQNMGFLVAMVFVIASFIIVLPYLNFDRLYRYTINVPTKWLNYTIGFLTVLLATPCTGPYMATSVGFALTGTYTDLIVVLSALALGLSAPYILILTINKPEDLFPKAGDWLYIVQLIMNLLLYLTLFWFFFLIWRQTNWQTPLMLGISLALFMLCFKLYLRFMDYLGRIIDEDISEIALSRTKKVFSCIMLMIFAALLSFNIYQAQKSYDIKLKINTSERYAGIDKDLIAQKLAQGKNVLLEIKADWCLTCQYNQTFVFTDLNMENWKNNYNLELITVDWTDYNKDVLDFMEKYGRKGLPFYVLFTPVLRDGIVLPELFSADDLSAMLINSYIK